MATLFPNNPSLAISPFPERTPTPMFRRARCYGYSYPKPFLRGSLSVTRLGLKPEFLPDPENIEGVFKELFGRAESFLYTIADAAVSSSASETVTTTKQNSDWLSGISNYMESVLKVLKGGLSAVHVPYAYGFAIILLTVLVKAATFPLTKKQVESAMSMRSLQPQIKAIQQRYAGNQERIQLETARLYKLAGINPFAGCLPTLVTIPIWIGLYRALSNVADEGLLMEGFFWIPSLAGPTTVTARQNGSGISWLFPFVDGHPPLGWSDTLAYLVLPILLIVSQYISIQIMQSSQKNDPDMKSSQVLTNVLPLMIGYFALSVPSGLSLYWFTNNILSSAQQVWLQKLGGAANPIGKLSEEIIEGDQPQVQKSVSQMISPQKEPKGEKLKLDGPQPGERFKQLKEIEARKRQQREEEKRIAEEAAAKSTEITNDRYENEETVLERENGTSVKLVVEKNEEYDSQNAIYNSSNGGVTVNGELSRQDSKEDQNTSSVFQTADGEVSTTSNIVGTVEQQSYESEEEESIEVYTSTAGRDDIISEDAGDVRRD